MSDPIKQMQAILTKLKKAIEENNSVGQAIEEAIGIVTNSNALKSDKKHYQYFCKDFTLELTAAIMKMHYINVYSSSGTQSCRHSL